MKVKTGITCGQLPSYCHKVTERNHQKLSLSARPGQRDSYTRLQLGDPLVRHEARRVAA
jgi:hypothetical protein